MSAKFIAFEGVDGVGKTSISKAVSNKLNKINGDVIYLDKKNIALYESKYVKEHMGVIKSVLWDYNPSEPLFELGDDHWLYLNLSWFSVVYNCLVKKYLIENKTVIVDGWYYKLYSRFLVKDKYQKSRLNKIFFNINEPDIVCYLDLDLKCILERKKEILPSEAGEMDCSRKISTKDVSSFIEYQTKVKNELEILAMQKQWLKFKNDDFEECTNSIVEKILFIKDNKSIL